MVLTSKMIHADSYLIEGTDGTIIGVTIQLTPKIRYFRVKKMIIYTCILRFFALN